MEHVGLQISDRLVIYHCFLGRSLEQGTTETSGLGELFDTHLQHLSQKHLDFFRSANSPYSLAYDVCTYDLFNQ